MRYLVDYVAEVRAIAKANVPELFGHSISINNKLPLSLNFAVSLGDAKMPGWTSISNDLFYYFDPERVHWSLSGKYAFLSHNQAMALSPNCTLHASEIATLVSSKCLDR